LALIPLLLCNLSGCLWTDEVDHSSFLKRFQNQTISPDHALIKVALIERPLGDDFINQRLWQHADELIVDLEKHGALEENGFRIGQLVGTPPSDFQNMLLKSKQSFGYPLMRIFPAGKTVPIDLGAVLPQSAYDV